MEEEKERLVRKETMSIFNNDELATSVFLNKYSLNGEETPDATCYRIAKEFARIEDNYIDKLSKEEILKASPNLSEYGRERLAKDKEERWNTTYNLMNRFHYIVPGGSAISGIGTNSPISLSNCFVVASPEDSVESIFNTARDIAQISKRRGGVGMDLSKLRPLGSAVNNSAKQSTGVVSFMELYSDVNKIISQNGRRGALMLTIDVNHPDVYDFINIKNDLSKVTSANISVRLNSEFKQAVSDDADYILRFPVDMYIPADYYKESYQGFLSEYNTLYELKDTDFTGYVKKVKARELWDNISISAWKSAEPGVFNWDRILNYDPTSVYPELRATSTNPCGELSLGNFDSCRLICTNLYSIVDNPFSVYSFINKVKAYKVFYEAQVMADALVYLELEAVDRILHKINPNYNPDTYLHKRTAFFYEHESELSEEFKLWWKIRDVGSKGRRTGTGITGYADMLAALGKPYGDPTITKEVFKLKLQAELDASIDMAILRGTFPLYDGEKEWGYYDGYYGMNDWYDFILSEYPETAQRMIKFGRRNSGISTIAPTGTISLMTQTSSGIEPVFMPIYDRKVTCKADEVPDAVDNGIGYKILPVIHPKLKEWFKINRDIVSKKLGIPMYDESDVQQLTTEDWQEMYKISPYYKQSAADIDPELRINTQALIQKYITSSISSTVNLPADAKKETVEKIYLDAFEKGCKGITVYREGSRGGILLAKGTSGSDSFNYYIPPKRPKELIAHLHLTKSKGHYYYVIVGIMEEKPYEIFVVEKEESAYNLTKKAMTNENLSYISGKIVKVKKNHYSFVSDSVMIDRLLEGNSEFEKYCTLSISMLLRQGSNIHYVIKTAKKATTSVSSFISAICRILGKYDTVREEQVCSVCGGRVVSEGGCTKCLDCGNSKCE